jgi:ADP-ribose pyrophosphatase YjhB (NUDIX family)
MIRKTPEGDTRERTVCDECGYVFYENPKLVVGTVVVEGGNVLLCRRAIEPRSGLWTLPGGFLELGETLQEGACREAFEEAVARIAIEGILAVYSVARIGQVLVIFRGRFAGPPVFAVGPESAEVALFAPEDIPWDEIAFPTTTWALKAWLAVGEGPLGAPAGNPAEDPRGTIWASSLAREGTI